MLADHTTIVPDALYAALTALCCLWLPLYTCLRYHRAAAVVLASSVVLSIAILVTATNERRWLTLPLVLWLSFATYLNTFRIIAQG